MKITINYNKIINHRHLPKYILGMFSYGFLRQFNTKPEDNTSDYLLINKTVFSTINGIAYVLPPFSIIAMYRTICRTEILLSNKDPKEYKIYYREWSNDCNFNTLF